MWYAVYDIAICSKKGVTVDGGRKKDRDGIERIEQVAS